MKWPEWLMLVRHDQSAYNVLHDQKRASALYRRFVRAYEEDPNSRETRALALRVQGKFALNISDCQTPLAPNEGRQARATGAGLRKEFDPPDIIYVSPYRRTLVTLDFLIQGWPELKDVRVVEDERIREQEHGFYLLYNDWRVFQALHPEQRALHQMEGRYWYRFPQGENIPDVRLRNRSWVETLIREYANKRVLAVTHQINILAIRANLERLRAEEFLRLNEQEKPINCGVTLYRGVPNQGKAGRLNLVFYNKKYY